MNSWYWDYPSLKVILLSVTAYETDRTIGRLCVLFHVHLFYLLVHSGSRSFIRECQWTHTQTQTRSRCLVWVSKLRRRMHCCQGGLRLCYINVAIYILMQLTTVVVQYPASVTHALFTSSLDYTTVTLTMPGRLVNLAPFRRVTWRMCCHLPTDPNSDVL